MRVALCFSGQLRNVQSTYEQTWKTNILDVNQHHQIDVFGHSWFDKNTVGTVYYASNRQPTAFTANAPIPDNVIQQIYDAYNPIKLELERSITFDEKNFNDRKLYDAVPQHGISRLYSIHRANILKNLYERDNGFIYDLVICARYDFKLLTPVLFDSLTEPGIYHPGYSPHGFNVCHAMGDSMSMNIYSDLYLNYESVFNTGIYWCDEYLAKTYLELLHLPVYDLSIPNELNRG